MKYFPTAKFRSTVYYQSNSNNPMKVNHPLIRYIPISYTTAILICRSLHSRVNIIPRQYVNPYLLSQTGSVSAAFTVMHVSKQYFVSCQTFCIVRQSNLSTVFCKFSKVSVILDVVPQKNSAELSARKCSYYNSNS
jgi:hypothetical protein